MIGLHERPCIDESCIDEWMFCRRADRAGRDGLSRIVCLRGKGVIARLEGEGVVMRLEGEGVMAR